VTLRRGSQKAIDSDAQRRIAAAVTTIGLWPTINDVIAPPEIRPGSSRRSPM
jgi:hypothetical protein